MELARRSFITGLIALVAAPAIVRAGSLMPVKMDIFNPSAVLTLESTWDEIITATLRNRCGILAESITNNNALLRRLRGDDFGVAYG